MDYKYDDYKYDYKIGNWITNYKRFIFLCDSRQWLMETVEEELGNFRILNVKKPFKVEGLSFREHL